MNDTEKVIERIDKYLALTRYEYMEMEKLSRLKILRDYYDSLEVVSPPSLESLNTEIEYAEQLSGNLILPLKVRGIFLTEGKPGKRFYTKEDLKQSVNNPINASFPICLDHKDKEIDKIVGQVERIEYDEAIKGIRWWGHINSELHARNVIDGAVSQVSATIFSVPESNSVHGTIWTDLIYKELSLVWDGAEKYNSIEVDGGGNTYK